jgi:transcriptional regulator with XRE-family HTH domain
VERPPDLGRRLRAAREYRGLSQSAFAEAIGLGQSTIARYENGELPDDRRLGYVLDDWARACQVPTDWFTAPWAQVGTTTPAATDGEPEWAVRVEDQLGLLVSVLWRVYPDVLTELIGRRLGDDAPAPEADAEVRRRHQR